MREPVLVILAAGMGSRYSKESGKKQVDPVGPCGEKIIDYSLYDAVRAGFRKAVFVIKEEHLPLFQESVFPPLEKHIEVSYVFQKLEDVPEGCTVPEGRVKPWGTGHAALTAARTLGDAPYAVINADDFYGREAYEKLYRFLSTAEDGDKMNFAMVGYYLKNTVTENGSVNRGVCQEKDGFLAGVTERINIERRPEGIAFPENGGKTWTVLPEDALVSMNFWGFTPGYTNALEEAFQKLFRDAVPQNPLKAELYLPFVVNDLIVENKARVTVLPSADKWYGVTYQEDKPAVAAGIRALTEKGEYPSPLWQA